VLRTIRSKTGLRQPAGAALHPKLRVDYALRCLSRVIVAVAMLTLFGALGARAVDVSPLTSRSDAPVRRYAVTKVAEIQLRHIGNAIWCYDRDPSFIFSDDQKLLRSDLDGNVSVLMEAPAYIEGLACSQDGKLVVFFSFTSADERLSILDLSTSQKSEYSIPAVSGRLFKPGYRSMMAPDGRVFALPSSPVLISGPDVLRNKKIVGAASGDVFWTPHFVFVGQDETNQYQVRRIDDLTDLGTVSVPAGRNVRSIVECQGSYLVHSLVDARQQELLEPLLDPKLGGRRGGVVKNVASVNDDYGVCSVVLTHVVNGADEVEAVETIGRSSRSILKIEGIERLGYRLTMSKDGHFILGSQMVGQIGSSNQSSRILLLRVER
jgi:hypothetical protein